MDERPPRVIVIEPRGNSWIIFLHRHVQDGIGGWRPVEQLIRCPKEEPLSDARAYAEQQKIKRGIYEPVEVRA